jgi:hypothetical protein
MKINTEEIARLLRVASSPIREKWETIRNGGKNLFELRLQREQLNALAESYEKKMRTLYRLMMIMAFVGLLEAISFPIWTHLVQSGKESFWGIILVVVILSPLLVLSVGYGILTSRFENASTARTQCDVVFDKFQRSIDALNPMGIGNRYHDIITEQSITNTAEHLALRVLDGEQRFEQSRLDLNEAAYNVIHYGNWTEKCRNDLERFWQVVTDDFGLKLDKVSIFDRAATDLARRKVK